MSADMYFFGPVVEGYQHDVSSTTTSDSFVEVDEGEDLPSARLSDEPLLSRCVGRESGERLPHVGAIEDLHTNGEWVEWTERVQMLEKDGGDKRKWSKRLSDGVAELGQKVVKKVSSVS